MSENPSPVAYDISLCLHDDAISSEPFALFGEGASVRILRRKDDGSLRSGLVTLPAGWQGRRPLSAGEPVQLFVRSGDLDFGGERLGAGAFVVVPAGGAMPALASAGGAELILILDEEAALVPATGNKDVAPAPIVTPDVFAVEPIVPVVGGRKLEGFERRVLWDDPRTGADTRLLRVPAGFTGAGGASFHPVEEEIFCLEGDIAPDDKTPMRAGSYLWNPRLSVHGFREHSNAGCLLLEWHDGLWSFHRYEGEPLETA